MASDYVKHIVAQELQALPDFLQVKGPYVCYILRSVVAPGRTYSGSTNDFRHRLRQHNGLIKGGASATRTTKPWRVATLVYGFSSRSAALRYEFFTKIGKASKSMIQGKNSLERRATLLIWAELKLSPEERGRLCYHIPDLGFRRCLEAARLQGVPGTLEAAMMKVVSVEETTKVDINQETSNV